MGRVKLKAMAMFHDFNKDALDIGRQIDPPPEREDRVHVGFVDRASQEGGQKCGVGTYIKLKSSLSIKLKMIFSQGTNIRGKLLALWCLLYFAYSRNKFLTCRF